MNETAAKMLFEAQRAMIPERLLSLREWHVYDTTYPMLEIGFRDHTRAELRVQMRCDHWNEQPPSVRLLGADGQLLITVPRDPAGIFNAGPHPLTGAPFICIRGSREYHTHSSHLTDDWSLCRNQSGYDLGGILTQIWRAWRKAQP
jgi:hypothetical protein